MGLPSPPQGFQWLARQPTFYGLLATLVFTPMVGWPTLLRAIGDQNYVAASMTAAGTLGVMACGSIAQALNLWSAWQKDSTSDLEGCLHILHAILAPEPECLLRIAVHRPVGDELQQITEYIGADPKKGRIGRRFPGNAGVIGKAFRERLALVATRQSENHQAFIQELKTTWNYTEAKARQLHPGAMQWMAAPVQASDGAVLGVLFLDVTEREFFTPVRQDQVLAATRGIAVFIARRYS